MRVNPIYCLDYDARCSRFGTTAQMGCAVLRHLAKERVFIGQ